MKILKKTGILGLNLLLITIHFNCSNLSTQNISDGTFLPDPEIRSIIPLSYTSLQITFAQDMKEEVMKAENYSITSSDGNLNITNVTAVAESDNKIVNIATLAQTSSLLYTLTVKNVNTRLGKKATEKGIIAAFTGYAINLDIPDINITQGGTSYGSGGVYNFGFIETGSSSAVITFIIENNGTWNLSLTGNPKIAISGENASMFTISQPTETILAPGETGAFTTTFSPTEGGIKSATINVYSNDPVESTYSLVFFGDSGDATSPAAGGSGAIVVSNVTKTSMDISWNLATDNLTSQENLEYLVYYSTLDIFDTVTQVEANFEQLVTSQKNIDSAFITGLTQGTIYYVNVIVKDEQGNKSVYNKAIQQTTPDSSRVADINATGDSYPYNLMVYNGKLYFNATDGINGWELWVYDGTNAPAMVADIHPSGSGSPTDSAVFNDGTGDKLYFNANNGSDGDELWVYDDSKAIDKNNGDANKYDLCSTGDNPCMVADINTTGHGSPSYLTVFNSKLYFQTNNGTDGEELWVYDGNTPTMVADIRTGTDNGSPSHLTVFNSKLYFNANDGTNGKELWVYDGTNAPSMVADIGNSADGPLCLTVFNSKLYFNADDGTNGKELWVYDGINAPSMVADIYSGSACGNPYYLTVFNSKLYFQAYSIDGQELWVYDGGAVIDGGDGFSSCSTGDNPCMAADINTTGSSGPSGLTVFNDGNGDKLYFQAYNGTYGKELWGYDGINPPAMLADINAGSNDSEPSHLTVFNGDLYFNANDGIKGAELFRYNEY